jgi:hypothetical protein
MRTPKPSGNSKKTHHRKAGSYDRQAGHRPISKRILIVCEGEKTEPNYFRAQRRKLKLPLVEIEIKEKAGPPISLVTTAEKFANERKKDEKFDEVWCVLDREGKHHNPTFTDAIQKAQSLAYKLAVSNPAFEFWYILHFESTTRIFANGEEVKTYLQKHIPDYEEKMVVWPLLEENTATAIENSNKFCKRTPAKRMITRILQPMCMSWLRI